MYIVFCAISAYTNEHVDRGLTEGGFFSKVDHGIACRMHSCILRRTILNSYFEISWLWGMFYFYSYIYFFKYDLSICTFDDSG